MGCRSAEMGRRHRARHVPRRRQLEGSASCECAESDQAGSLLTLSPRPSPTLSKWRLSSHRIIIYEKRRLGNTPRYLNLKHCVVISHNVQAIIFTYITFENPLIMSVTCTFRGQTPRLRQLIAPRPPHSSARNLTSSPHRWAPPSRAILAIQQSSVPVGSRPARYLGAPTKRYEKSPTR